MSKQAAVETFRRAFSVGRFHCEVTAHLVAGKPIAVQCAWSPYLPKKLPPALQLEYEFKRNLALEALAEYLDGAVLVANLEEAPT
jgi:hypothetical protein